MNLKDKSVLIVGFGVVGQNLYRELSRLEIDVYDKYKDVNTNENKKYDFAFICVDTPKTESEVNYIADLWDAIHENDADIYIIKSTVLPGTVEKLRIDTGKKIVFSPEYYGGTQHANSHEFRFTILGGEKRFTRPVQQLLQENYDGRHQFHHTDAKTAELVKYMENSWLATKVTFMTQFYNLATKVGVDYGELRELFILDPRVNPSHTFVYKDQPYWQSHCLDKDVPAIAEHLDAPFLKAVVAYNESQKGGNQE